MNMQPCSCKKTKTLVEISVIRPRQWLFFFFFKGLPVPHNDFFGVNSSEFPSEILAIAFFCVLSVLMLFAQLIQGDAEHPKASSVRRWGCQVWFYQQCDCC